LAQEKSPINSILAKHWLDVELGIKKSFLPLPDGVVFETSIEEIKGLRKELSEIHKRLSILEGEIHDKFYPLNSLCGGHSL